MNIERGLYGWYNMWRSNIWRSKSRCVWECGIGIYDIMCDDITCEDLHLASITGLYDLTCDVQMYNDLNPDVYENVVLGLMI